MRPHGGQHSLQAEGSFSPWVHIILKGHFFIIIIYLLEGYGEGWTIQSNATGMSFARQHEQI